MPQLSKERNTRRGELRRVKKKWGEGMVRSVAKVVRFSESEAKANFENFGKRLEKNWDEFFFQSINVL